MVISLKLLYLSTDKMQNVCVLICTRVLLRVDSNKNFIYILNFVKHLSNDVRQSIQHCINIAKGITFHFTCTKYQFKHMQLCLVLTCYIYMYIRQDNPR